MSKELDIYLKNCNLIFTDTIDRLDFCRVDFDIDKININYDNSISLLNLVCPFNKLYLSFKKELEKLEKLNLGKQIEVLSFNKFDYSKDNYRVLTIYIDEPTIVNHEDTILYLREINGEIKSFATNDTNPYVEGYYCEYVTLSKDIATKYLDLFEKYSLLLETFNYLENSSLFGDGTHCIFTSIDNYNGNLLDGLKTFKVSFGSAYFNTEYFIELAINLGESFGIDYDNCKMILDGKHIDSDKKEYDKVLERVYVNKNHIKEIERK